MNIKIDYDFKKCLPALTPEEYANLEASILKEGVRDPIILWNETIIDGHNRYQICTDHNITEFPTTAMDFKSKDQALEWILQNQLGRRNLTDFQRNKIALQYEEVIAKRMKERMSERGKDQAELLHSGKGGRNRQPLEKTSKRKELAKIAGTSEFSIRNTKTILEKGTPEQIERAEKGGKGNSLTAIAREITAQDETKKCKTCGRILPISEFREGHNSCKTCSNRKPYKGTGKYDHISDAEVIGDLYNEDKFKPYTIEDVVQEFEANFEVSLDMLEGILSAHTDVLKDQDNNKKIQTVLEKAEKAFNEMKRRYEHEKL
ncbi:MAG: ParB N-terminal domain-containing protein [Clostridiales Family XIII bacterium]|uniref:ParB N-terminal domain-containing protein n=1 Tax=Hominibacterium faecale TaxID=2839743 RepID=A0A9J6QTV4_9FIRM|nr:ParB N-terminal domain-containing protein [Hominibacterium faecale]MCI7304081.1 ParB N-terminal domain-containing protein [Clostridia bacterium]MCU7379746.1 ParB N-terminal domain-containing protein [Hominibacterium faecale]MDY3011731.1 ParB N-terminal domain-containing protein [Clostridiales Family XIII bacterium]